MRFTYDDPDRGSNSKKSNMPLLSRLIKDLGMEDQVKPFYMAPQRIPPNPNEKLPNNCNARFYNGQHFTYWYANQNPTMWKNLFNLERQEEFKSAGELVKDIYRKLLDHNKSNLYTHFQEKMADVIIAQEDIDLLQEYENAEYWTFFRNKFTWNVGMQEFPLNEFSMQALLTAMGYSHQCCMMMVQAQGFLFVSLSEGNVGAILPELITFEIIWNKLYQFKKGWSSLVNTLVEHLEEYCNQNAINLEMKKNCEVSQLVENNKGGYIVKFKECKPENETPMSKLEARNLVLAIPPKATEDILNSSKRLADKDEIMKICKSVEGVHLTKINLYFEDDWWNQDKDIKMYGPSMTSLPCAFIYPFYGDCLAAGCQGCDLCKDIPCPAALTIYCDVNNAQFWSSLQRLGHKFQSPLQNEKKKLLPASEPVVLEALKQFKKIFNIENIPHPILTSYRSWDGEEKTNIEEEHGYGIHVWELGVDDKAVRKKVSQPTERNLYMCNEAWSGYQGWVEGSLMSTQDAVNRLLNLGADE